ncbi:MAG: penicillin-binding transpeptidase domain-containing protein, partial [Bacteroidota bacterium]
MSSTNEGQNRGVIIQIIFFATGLILLVQAMRLQILDDTYARRAEATTIDQFTLYPSRGLIFDRNGELLVNNNLVYDLLVTYNQIDADMDTLKFCRLLGIEQADFERRLKKNWSDVRYSKRKPFVFMSTISAESFTKFQESLYEFPGFFAQRRNVRGYPYPNAAHILGFIREVDQRELEANQGIYNLGDYIGGSGLERMYEDALRGEKGARFVLQDNQGNEIEEYKSGELNKNAVSGADLTTTLDIELQAYVEELMENKIGGVVVLEAKTGEVLAMASMPDYDPNLLTINRNRGKAVQELSLDSLKPFFNRALMAQYPPGSIFKPVVGLIAMEEGVSQPKRQIYCPGFYAYNGFTWGCRAHPLPRNVGVGIQYSCNTYFFQTFRDIIDKESFYKPEVGLDLFVDHLRQFGLGDSLRIDLPGEEEGHVPT